MKRFLLISTGLLLVSLALVELPLFGQTVDCYATFQDCYADCMAFGDPPVCTQAGFCRPCGENCQMEWKRCMENSGAVCPKWPGSHGEGCTYQD